MKIDFSKALRLLIIESETPLGCFSASTGSWGDSSAPESQRPECINVWEEAGHCIGGIGWGGAWHGVHPHPCILELPRRPVSLARRQGPGGGGARQPDSPAALRLHGRLPLERGLWLLPPQRRVRAWLRRPTPGYGVASRVIRSHQVLRSPGGQSRCWDGFPASFTLRGARWPCRSLRVPWEQSPRFGSDKDTWAPGPDAGVQAPPSGELYAPHLGRNPKMQGSSNCLKKNTNLCIRLAEFWKNHAPRSIFLTWQLKIFITNLKSC